MNRLPNHPPRSVIEGVKKPPIDIIRREPTIATHYAEVVYTRGGRSDAEQAPTADHAPAHSSTKQRIAASRIMAMMQSVLRFVQGFVAGMAILAMALLFHQTAWESLTQEAVVPADAKTAPVTSAPIPATPASAASAPRLSAPHAPEPQIPAADARRLQLEQELRELQAINHLLTAQVEDLRRKLVITKADLSTMTSTKDYYVQKVKEVEDAVQDQQRQNWVAQRALGRALDKINP